MAFSLKDVKHRTILLADLATIVLGYFLAFFLRFEFNIPAQYMPAMLSVLPVFVAVKIPLFFVFRMYEGMWRYTSLYDVFNIMKAVITGNVILFFLVTFTGLFPSIPRSIFVLDMGICMMVLPSIRMGIRVFYSHLHSKNGNDAVMNGERKDLLIIGAGNAGEQVIREIKVNPLLNYNVIGFLDDDLSKRNSRIHGIPVLTVIDDLPNLHVRYDEILIAIPTANGSQMRHIVNLCKQTGKPFRTVPGISEIINGKLSFNAIRDVSINDIIGREEVNLDKHSVNSFLENKTVLITGAGGSIGSELVRQCLSFSPREIVLVDNSEFNLFTIHKECTHYNGHTRIRAILADIRHKEMMEQIFIQKEPQVVFHAAAYKHVPIQEEFPWQAVGTNVKGTKNLVELSEQYGVQKFILVSTDKAVRPTSVMGATKRLAELLIHENGVKRKTKFMAVRFGNVIGSSGSVVPIFKEQIEKGGPVTVTHPKIERYFMSIPEAAQLILQAGALGDGGEIFVLKMGDPIKINTVAKELIRLSGYEPNVDIPITYTGLRPGEKMYEELITQYESQKPTEHNKIMILESSYNKYDTPTFLTELDELFYVTSLQDRIRILKKIKDIIPAYEPWNDCNDGNGEIKKLDIVNR